MVGLGIAPEGINQNDVMYEFMNEQNLQTARIDIDKWLVISA